MISVKQVDATVSTFHTHLAATLRGIEADGHKIETVSPPVVYTEIGDHGVHLSYLYCVVIYREKDGAK